MAQRSLGEAYLLRGNRRGLRGDAALRGLADPSKLSDHEAEAGTNIPVDATKSYQWRIDQLTRLENLLKENEQANYSNCSTTISGFDPSRSGGPQVPAPLEVKTCILPIWLRP